MAFALALFAQIGLLSHLIVRLTPDVGVASAGLLVSLATICAMLGRTLAGRWIGDHDRRIGAAVNIAVQIIGVLLLIFGNGGMLLTLGCILFGLGIGNLISLPPLIAQQEFERQDVVTVVSLIVAINQAVFAFAPALVGALRDATSDYLLPFPNNRLRPNSGSGRDSGRASGEVAITARARFLKQYQGQRRRRPARLTQSELFS